MAIRITVSMTKPEYRAGVGVMCINLFSESACSTIPSIAFSYQAGWLKACQEGIVLYVGCKGEIVHSIETERGVNFLLALIVYAKAPS